VNSQQSQAICIQSSVKEKLSHKMAQMDIELKKVSGRQVAKKADCRRRARALPKNLVIDDSFCTQAFTEMQINKLETTKKIHMIDMKCDMVKTGKQKYQLTEKGTSSLADDTRYITRITINHLQVFRWLIELFPYRVYQSHYVGVYDLLKLLRIARGDQFRLASNASIVQQHVGALQLPFDPVKRALHLIFLGDVAAPRYEVRLQLPGQTLPELFQLGLPTCQAHHP